MSARSTPALPAHLLSFFEPLERRYFFAADFAVEAGGVFADPFPQEDRGELLVSGTETPIFKWGEGADGGESCGLVFAPGSASGEANLAFAVGTITLQNRPTSSGEAASVVLQLRLKINDREQLILVPLGIDNSVNTDDPDESRDLIFLEAGPIVGESLTDSSGRKLALVVLGFGPKDASSLSDELLADEDGEASAQVLVGMLEENLIATHWLHSSDVPQWLAENREVEDEFEDEEEELEEEESDEQPVGESGDGDEDEEMEEDPGEEEVFDDEPDDELSDEEVWEDD